MSWACAVQNQPIAVSICGRHGQAHTPITRTGTQRLHNNEANPSIYTKCFAFLPPFPTDNKIFLFHLREVHTHSDGDQQQGHGDRVEATLLVSHRRHLLGLGVLGCVGVNLQRETAFFNVNRIYSKLV
jgi:hypothetical protein